MHEPSPLEQLSGEFAAWRSSRPGSKATPRSLRQRTVELKSSHRVSHILAALGINHSTLKRWSADQTVTPEPAFIPLPSVPRPVETSTGASDVLCELPNGIRLTLSSQGLNSSLLSALAQVNTEVRL